MSCCTAYEFLAAMMRESGDKSREGKKERWTRAVLVTNHVTPSLTR